MPVLIKNYTRKKYRRHPSPPLPRASPTPISSLFFPRPDVVTLSFHLVPALSYPPASLPPSPNSSTARQASQTSGIHYSCRPTPLDGGTLKIVRKQIRPAHPRRHPPPPLSPIGVSTRRRASYAIARNDARLIGTTRDIFIPFSSFLPSFPPPSFFSPPLPFPLHHHRSYDPKSAVDSCRVYASGKDRWKGRPSREPSLDRFNRVEEGEEGWREGGRERSEIRGARLRARSLRETVARFRLTSFSG